jgi:hypothetical protein
MLFLGVLSVLFLGASVIAGSWLFLGIAALLYAGEWSLYFVGRRVK